MNALEIYSDRGYTGGKGASGVYQKIINEIRPFDILIIPFLGHCAISRNIALGNAKIIGIDLDSTVIDNWQQEKFTWIELHNSDGIEKTSELLATLPSTSNICIYADPTYRMCSIKSEIEPYTHTMSDDDHYRFLDNAELWAMQSNVDVLISHYPDSLYETRLSKGHGWRSITYQYQTRRGPATEMLFMNYNHIDGKLHDYQYMGDNKHERYNLKHRTAKNLIAKLERMEVRKRQAVLHYLQEYLNQF